jgi:ribonuclease T1
MKRAWAYLCIVALCAIFAGCNKEKSQSAKQDADASAAQSASPVLAASEAPAAPGSKEPGALVTIRRAQLPGEAAETLRLIKAGGPFPYKEDGVLFRNTSGLLAQHPRGYYRAYTVFTPGAKDRGLKRIVCGGARKQVSDCYYTEDYYVSFKRIAE